MRQRGFTLLELLIVITIIGILSAIVMVALADSRRDTRNQAVVSQMTEYQKAIELYYSDVGEYPGTNTARNNLYCFGTGATGNCFPGTAGVTSASLTNAFGTYMSDLPRFTQTRGGLTYHSPAYSGCANYSNPGNFTTSGGSSCTEKDYSIFFLLEGTGEDCGRALVADPALSGEFTLCRLMPAREI